MENGVWKIYKEKGKQMEDKKIKEAKKRVKELKVFYTSLTTYICVNIGLFLIDFITSPSSYWFYWVSIFWGIAIGIQAAKVFVLKGRFLGKEWEKRKLKEFMEE